MVEVITNYKTYSIIPLRSIIMWVGLPTVVVITIYVINLYIIVFYSISTLTVYIKYKVYSL